MGTNFYAHVDPCGECGHAATVVHIGKSSRGWVFSLHVGGDAPEHLRGWTTFLKRKGVVIKDEYSRVVSLEDLLEIITKRAGRERGTTSSTSMGEGAFFDPYVGLWRVSPNGAWSNHRTPVMGKTYDLCRGEFS